MRHFTIKGSSESDVLENVYTSCNLIASRPAILTAEASRHLKTSQNLLNLPIYFPGQWFSRPGILDHTPYVSPMKGFLSALHIAVLTFICTVTALDGSACFVICYLPAVEQQCPGASSECVCTNEEFILLLNMCIQRTCQESLFEAEDIHANMCR